MHFLNKHGLFLYSEQYFYIIILMIFNSLQTLDITIVIDH
ncbi:putative membrane protein [Staphylococcus aureus]|nr:putative membrane protein [Staphylococcus aureus]